VTKGFTERFNIRVGSEEARKKFVNRALNLVFEEFLYETYDTDDRSSARRAIATALGDRYQSHLALDSYIGGDFLRTLQSIEALYSFVPRDLKNDVAQRIEAILSEAETDLGVRWKGDHFEPAGAELLDKGLVDENLNWLRQKGYKSVVDPFEKGLKHLLSATNDSTILSDVITDMYEALEALAKIATGRQDKDLSANYEALIAKINASGDYKTVLKPTLKFYIEYANKFRHAAQHGNQKPTPSREETESFVYFTGIFIRLALP